MHNGTDYGAIIGIMAEDGTDIIHSSVIGGESTDQPTSVIMMNGSIIVSLYTYSKNFPNHTIIKNMTDDHG
jgi:hypothetical protein